MTGSALLLLLATSGLGCHGKAHCDGRCSITTTTTRVIEIIEERPVYVRRPILPCLHLPKWGLFSKHKKQRVEIRVIPVPVSTILTAPSEVCEPCQPAPTRQFELSEQPCRSGCEPLIIRTPVESSCGKMALPTPRAYAPAPVRVYSQPLPQPQPLTIQSQPAQALPLRPLPPPTLQRREIVSSPTPTINPPDPPQPPPVAEVPDLQPEPEPEPVESTTATVPPPPPIQPRLILPKPASPRSSKPSSPDLPEFPKLESPTGSNSHSRSDDIGLGIRS